MMCCDLYNSTYRAEFNFINGIEKVQVTMSELDDKPMSTVSLARSLLNVTSAMPKARCNILGTHSEEQECIFNVGVLKTLLYQGILGAFTQQLGEKLSLAQNSNDTFVLDANTSITTIVLSKTAELAFINNYDQFSSAHWTYLQDP